MRNRTIRLSPGPFGKGFNVEILPPLDAGNFDQHCDTLKRARGYAGGLKFTLGLPLIDLCGEADG